jgi:hypothetical protein
MMMEGSNRLPSVITGSFLGAGIAALFLQMHFVGSADNVRFVIYSVVILGALTSVILIRSILNWPYLLVSAVIVMGAYIALSLQWHRWRQTRNT